MKLEPEVTFFEGGPDVSEVVAPAVSILTVIGIVPFTAALARQAWVKYTITSRRIKVSEHQAYRGAFVLSVANWRGCNSLHEPKLFSPGFLTVDFLTVDFSLSFSLLLFPGPAKRFEDSGLVFTLDGRLRARSADGYIFIE